MPGQNKRRAKYTTATDAAIQRVKSAVAPIVTDRRTTLEQEAAIIEEICATLQRTLGGLVEEMAILKEIRSRPVEGTKPE